MASLRLLAAPPQAASRPFRVRATLVRPRAARSAEAIAQRQRPSHITGMLVVIVTTSTLKAGRAAADQSDHQSSTRSPSPPSGLSDPIATSSKPSGPPSNARTVLGATRTTSHKRSSTISSSSFARPDPPTTR
jgi:hypothetical protein